MTEGSRRIEVAGRYPVVVGADALEELAPRASGRAVLVVHQPGRPEQVSEVCAVLSAAGAKVVTHEVPDAEAAKTAEAAAGIWAQLGRADFTRQDLIVGLGGGAVTDLAGFVAATWLRGVPVVQIPTSLLGTVDAAVGGKTGINTAEGKNLVGAFHEPEAVLCRPQWLASQSRADYASGMAEVLKCGFIADPVILELLEADPQAALDARAPVALELIARAVQVKADVVAADLHESSLREILNYGHTFAHAVEQVEGYRWRHGDAVALGMIYVAELGHRAGRTSADLVRRHRHLVSALGLPTGYPAGRWPELRAAMARDKKTRGDLLRFVVLDEVGAPGRLEGPPEEWLQSAYAAVSASSDGSGGGASAASVAG